MGLWRRYLNAVMVWPRRRQICRYIRLCISNHRWTTDVRHPNSNDKNQHCTTKGEEKTYRKECGFLLCKYILSIWHRTQTSSNQTADREPNKPLFLSPVNWTTAQSSRAEEPSVWVHFLSGPIVYVCLAVAIAICLISNVPVICFLPHFIGSFVTHCSSTQYVSDSFMLSFRKNPFNSYTNSRHTFNIF